MKKLFACLLAAVVLTGTSAFAQQQATAPQPLDRIAAVVDEDVILRSELDRAINNINRQYAGRENQLPPRDVLERQVLERLVLMKLQLARAEQTGVRVTDQEVDSAIAGIAQQNKLSMDQLRQQAVVDGGTFEDFRNSIRDELIVQRLRQRFAQSRISVSEAEIEAALAAQKNAGAQYHLAHILVALPEGATPEQISTAKSKIEGVQGLLDRGEMDFSAAAVRYSNSPNALEGGDLGWRSMDEIPAAFASLIKNMKPGDVSAPLRGASGFQLLKLVEVRDAGQAAGANMITQIHARHILIRTDDTTSQAAAKAKIDTIAARLRGGADFAQVAREESQDLSSQVASLSDGQVSAPFTSDAGWHIVQRIATRQTDTAEQNRRAQVSDTIGRRKLEDEWNRALQEMRGEAYFLDMRNGLPAEPAPAPAAKGTKPAKPPKG
jgi:peptidyl-prolyl cis-trans isomerase SurA